MYLLDTNVISETSKERRNEAVLTWLGDRWLEELYLSTLTLTELRRGIETLPSGKKRRELQQWMEVSVKDGFRERILSVTVEIAELAGSMAAVATKSGHTPEAMDLLIAATARAHGMALATMNRKDFERLGVELVEF